MRCPSPDHQSYFNLLDALPLAELVKLREDAMMVLKGKKAAIARSLRNDFSRIAEKARLTAEERQHLFG